MAEEVGFAGLFSKIKLLYTKITENELNKKHLFRLCSALLERKEQFLSKSNEDSERFFDHLIAPLSSCLVKCFEEAKQEKTVFRETCNMIIEFCVKHIHSQSAHFILSKVQHIRVVESLYKKSIYFSMDEIIQMEEKKILVPENLREEKIHIEPVGESITLTAATLENLIKERFIDISFEEKSDWKEHIANQIKEKLLELKYGDKILQVLLDLEVIKKFSGHYKESLKENSSRQIIETLNAMQLTEELSLVKDLLVLPVYEPLSGAKVNQIRVIVRSCLEASLYLATGFYLIDKDEVKLKTDVSTSGEEFCRKYGWKSSELSFTILEQVSNMFSNSSRLSAHVSPNLQAESVIITFEGLGKAIGKDREVGQLEDQKQRWKCASMVEKEEEYTGQNIQEWTKFEGLNIMLVTMTSRLIPMLSSLMEDMKNETDVQCKNLPSLEETDIYSCTSPWKRMLVMMHTISIPSLLIDLFFAAHEKGVRLSSLKKLNSSSSDSLKESKKENKKGDTSSEEENSMEEGSMLGSFFVQTISNPEKSEDEIMVKEKEKEDPYFQSGEIFLLLSNSLLHFTTKFFPICISYGLKSYIQDSLNEERLVRLANLLVEMESSVIGNETFLVEVFSHVSKLLCKLLSDDMLTEKKMIIVQGALKIRLDKGQHWPLALNRYVLLIFSKLAINNLVHCKRAGDMSNCYAYLAWKSYLQSLKAAMSTSSCIYSNLEYVQLMVFLYQLLPQEQKKETLLHVINIIPKLACVDSKIVSPIHMSRLIVIFEYLLYHCYEDEVPAYLLQQVQTNVLSFEESSKEEDEKVSYCESAYNEESIWKKLGLKEPYPKSLFFSLQLKTNGRFSEKMMEFLQSEIDYKAWYHSYMILLSIVFNKLNTNHVDHMDLLGLRHSFLCMWSLMKKLPISKNYLVNVDAFMESSVNEEKLLFYVQWVPMLYEFTKEQMKKDICIIPSVKQEDESELDTINKNIVQLVTTPAAVLKLGKNIISFITNFMNEKPKGAPYILFDGLILFFFLLLKKYVLEQKDESRHKQEMKALMESVMNLLKTCVDQSKKFLVAWSTAETEISGEIEKFYIDVIGIHLPQPSANMAEMPNSANANYLKGLPAKFEDSLKTWRDLEIQLTFKLIPALFSGLKVNEVKDNVHMSAIISSCVHHVVASNVAFGNFSPPYLQPAVALKRFIRTLADLCEEFVPWLQTNCEKEFESIKPLGMSIFSSLWIDNTASFIVNQMEMLTLLCLDQPDQNKLEKNVFIRILEVIEKWMTKENLFSQKDLIEPILVNWLLFMCRLIDHSKTLSVFVEFVKARPGLIYFLIQSIADPMLSSVYFNTVILMFTKILEFGEKNIDAEILLSIVQIVNEQTEKFVKWINNAILGNEHSKDGCNLLRLIIHLAIQKGVALEECLKSQMNCCDSVISDALQATDSPSIAKNLSFSGFFDIVVNTATSCGEQGHLMLLENVLKWLNSSKDVWVNSVSKSRGKKSSNQLSEICNTLMLYVTNILTCMSSSEKMVASSSKKLEYINSHLLEGEETDEDDSDCDDIGDKVCTFTITQKDFMNQHWYHCHTCKMNDGVGCCTVCAKVCHKEHDVTYSKHGDFFCDCGAKEDGSCKAMPAKKSNSSLSLASKSSSRVSPFTAWGEPTSKSSLQLSKEHKRSSKGGSHKTLSTYEGDELLLLKQVLKNSKEEILAVIKSSEIFDCILTLLAKTNEIYTKEKEDQKNERKNQKINVKENLMNIYVTDKECEVTDKLIGQLLASKDNAFENVKLNFSGDQGQVLRQLMLSHVIHHKAMCMIATSSSKKKQFAVAHEKGKVSILSLTSLLKDIDANQKKLSLSRVSSTLMPFTVLNICSNPSNEDYLAVTGLKDCHVLTLSQSIPGRLVLSPKLETGNFIIKALWVPGSQTNLALVTADFIKVYDLSKDEKEPVYHFILPTGKVRDATFIKEKQKTLISVMSSQGYIHVEDLNDKTSGSPFYLMDALAVEHETMEETEQGLLNGGGTSVYYAPLLKILFFSYTKGKSFAGVLDDGIKSFAKIFPITSSLITNSPLVQWNEVADQLGLIHCIQQSNNNLTMLAIKKDKILIQDMKTGTKSSKIQSAFCYHTNSGKHTATSDDKTLLFALQDDGCLKVLNLKADGVQPSMLPIIFSPRIHHPEILKKEKHGKTITKPRSTKAKFPIDFFEHCNPTNEIEYGGSDLLEVYNVNQIKSRLNTNGMYIANTKASGFKLEAKNTNSSNIIVGIRVQIGVQSMERSPQYVDIYGRIVKLKIAKNRWFDIPFTREESLKLVEENKLIVAFGPSSDPYGLSIVDSLKIYVKTKDAFGYSSTTEQQAQDQDSESTPLMSPQPNESSIESVPTPLLDFSKPKSQTEKLLVCLLATTNKYLELFDMRESKDVYQKLVDISSNLLKLEICTIDCYTLIDNYTNELLQNLFPNEEHYHKKDELRVKYLLAMYHAEMQTCAANNSLFDIDVFELILSITVAIGSPRPENLVKYLSNDINLENFVHELVDALWKIHADVKTNSNDDVSAQDLNRLSEHVEMITEILFSIMLGDERYTGPMSDSIMKLLLVKDQYVSFAAKQGLLKALHSRQKLNSLKNAPSEDKEFKSVELKDSDMSQTTNQQQPPPSQPTPEPQALVNLASLKEATSSAPILPIAEDVEEEDAIIEELQDEDQDMQEQEDIEMFLDNDTAMMEIALALSLQNQDSVTQNDDDVADDDDNDENDDEDDDDDDEDINEDDDEFEEEEIHEDVNIDEEVNHDDGDASDNHPESFAESPSFIETPKIISADNTDQAFASLWPHLLRIFIDKIPELMKLDGHQAIPYLQVLLLLCSNLSDSEEDKVILKDVVTACIQPLQIKNSDSKDAGERNKRSEIQLVLMRFLSVLMSRSNSYKQVAKEGKASGTESSTCDVYVAKMLADMGLIDHCLFLLKHLLTYWQTHKTEEDDSSLDSNALLKVKPTYQTPDMMPFFMEQYVKSHALDLFESFPQLVSEMILRVPYQTHKLISSEAIESCFDKEWSYVLCEYMLLPNNPFIRRQVRKLLLALCGSKEKYRYVKDLHNLRSRLAHIQELLHKSDIVIDDVPTRIISLSYTEIVSLTESVSGCIEIANARKENWQSFCKKEKAILPFLVQASYQLSEHISTKFIELIRLALIPVSTITTTSTVGSTNTSQTSSKKQEKQEKTKNLSNDLIKHVYSRCFGVVLISFTRCFLLESNSSPLRWRVHELIHSIYLNVTREQQGHLVELLWCLWETIPTYGHRAAQFVDLLGFFSIKAAETTLKEKICEYINGVIRMLNEGNKTLVNHHNASLYRKLQNFVELDGYYLESDPCVICNYPEETFNTYKLSAIKSDMRYTTKSQLIKLSTNYTISKINLKISDIKRAKTVKVINFMYNNKLVPSVVELKKTGIWHKAKKVNLTQNQGDVKVEFIFPITACNLMIEFAEFYEIAQFSSETLQCPRCSASVPAHPGVCSNCGENVFQCHKCRAINYDERDPFLCTSCGFCKYAKFELTLSCHPCCSVEPINNEEDREKALKSVNVGLEKADQFYQQLSEHRQILETLVKKAIDAEKKSSQVGSSSKPGMVWNVSQLASSNNASAAASASAAAMTSINPEIQGIAQRYCVDCKNSFEEMSKITQSVLETRKELLQYDIKQKETLSQALYETPQISASPSSTIEKPSFSRLPSFASYTSEEPLDNVGFIGPKAPAISKCYGCALSTVQHCLTILRALSTFPFVHESLLKQGLLQELIEFNLQQGRKEVITLAQTLLIKLTAENIGANDHLNQILCDRIKLCLTTQAANMMSEISLHSEISLLKKSVACADALWEQRFRCVVRLFLESLQYRNPDVLEAVTLPCLQIINSCIKGSAESNKKVIPVNKQPVNVPPVMAIQWMNQQSGITFASWRKGEQSSSQDDARKFYLIRKYGCRWLAKTRNQMIQLVTSVTKSGWLRELLFASSSRTTRQTISSILEKLVETKPKKIVITHIMMRYLDELHDSGENAMEFLSLMKSLVSSGGWKLHLYMYGIVDKLCSLLTKEVDYLLTLEHSTLSFDLAQGYALYALADLLKSFLSSEQVLSQCKGRYVPEVLQCYLTLRKLVVQRTKLVDEAQEILLNLLYSLTSGNEEDSSFIRTCINALRKCPVNDIRTPVFIFEQVCNIIHKEKEEHSEFHMLLEKDPQQEDYLQGRMQGNPYSSKDDGLGPLMRDIKNKICTECELVALLEDDTGMELLVTNRIISLDLPVDKVYKKIWCSSDNKSSKEPMKIIYRMRGLLGDATEDMIENLDSEKEKDVDEEHEYRRAAIMADIGGLDTILRRLSFIHDLSHAQQLVSVVLKLLEYCVKVKVNRQYLNRPTTNAMKIMLATLNLALRLERDHGSQSGGATVAERVLKIMEILLHEASTEADVDQPVVEMPGEESQLELLLNHITSPYVRSNQNVLQAMMRLTPFLTFGSEEAMHTLLEHFMPFFDFDKFDKEKSPDAILHLDCFCMIAEGISPSASGSKLKDLIIEKGIVGKALEYLHSHTPPKSFRASGILDSAKWKDFLAKPALLYILKLLTGLIKKHEKTQVILASDENIALLHHLEQVASDEMVGSKAENLMEALREFPEGKKKVAAVRRQTRNEKKALAMAMRQKQLESLGMVVTSTGHIKAKSTAATKEMEQLQDDKDQRLVCCICREGYKFYPNKVLGIYTFTSRCVLEDFENKPRRSQGYTTVSHFNVIHFDCHIEAVRHARSRDEWESAALQNSNTKCNGLMPIWGPKVSESSFATCLARHNSYIQEATGFREPTFHSTLHDIRLILLKFANQRSFYKETGGGGNHSNMYLVTFMIHIGLYVLNTTRQRMSEEQLLKSFLDAPGTAWISSCYEVNGPFFLSVLSIFVQPLSEWKAKKITFVKRLLLLAHVRNISSVPMNKLVNDTVKEYNIYKPYLMFYCLIDELQQLCKSTLAGNDDWPYAMSTYFRNSGDVILRDADKILKKFEEEYLPCESLNEFFDVIGLLADVPDPVKCIKDILAPYVATEESAEIFC